MAEDDGQDETYESLHEAAEVGQTEAVRELIDSGADVSEFDDAGFTPIWPVTMGMQRLRKFCWTRGLTRMNPTRTPGVLRFILPRVKATRRL